MEPGASVIPVPLSRRGRHAEGLAGLVHGQAREVAQLDKFCGGRILAGQLGESVVDREELDGDGLGGQIQGINVQSLERVRPMRLAC